MPTKLPKELLFYATDPSVKKIFISDYGQQPGSNKCANCGGTGIVAAFIATEGPYDHPAGPYATKKGPDGKDIRITSHSEEINKQVRWWVGRSLSVACPECATRLAPMGSPSLYQATHYQKQVE